MSRLYAVDAWVDGYDPRDAHALRYPMAEVEATFWGNVMGEYGHRVTVLRMWSWEAAKHVADGSLDLAYIDAGHQYAMVVCDIADWRAKVRTGSVLAGHDYNAAWDGVRRAVDEALGGGVEGLLR